MGANAPTCKETVEAYLLSKRRSGELTKRTVLQYRSILRLFVLTIGPEKLVRSVSRQDFQAWREVIGHPSYSAWTRRIYWQRVSGWYQWCLAEGFATKDARRGTRPPKVPRPVSRALDADQIHAMFAAAKDDRETVILVLMFQLGLRRSEVVKAEHGDVSWSTKTIIVHGKGGVDRVLPLPDEAWRVLRRYVVARGGVSGPLITAAHGGALAPETLGSIWRRIAVRAGVKHRAYDGVASHASRHTAASDVWTATKDTSAVQRMLGHSNLATTSNYVRGLDIEGLRVAMEGRIYAHSTSGA